MSFSEKPVYLIFGANGGIGSQVAKQLVAGNNHVVLLGRNQAQLAVLAQELQTEYLVVDAADLTQVQACFDEVMNKMGRIDGVVNCVGSILLKPAHLTTVEEWQTTLQTNLGSAFAVVKAAGKTMIKGGSVILMSSAAATVGLPNHEAIAAAKAGIEGLALSAAATYAGRNLRFNAIAPGLVETKLTERITKNAVALAASIANHPLGRLGQPEEIARLIVWLLDVNNSWISGQVFHIDGGLSNLRVRTTIQT
jgi:3-oxoacyl-[acyl-carrier protein] reductase